MKVQHRNISTSASYVLDDTLILPLYLVGYDTMNSGWGLSAPECIFVTQSLGNEETGLLMHLRNETGLTCM